MRGKFLLVDGMDGSGKNTLLQFFRKQCTGKVLDLHDFWKQHHRHPTVEELDCDILFSGEPTYVLAGKMLREEFIRTGSPYSVATISQAFALDRQILYEQVLIPALRKGITIIQSRGVTSSLVYQPLQGEIDVSTLPGNALALSPEWVPDMLVLLTTSPKIVMQRLERRDKKDDSLFEEQEFQERVRAGFLDEKLHRLFSRNGCNVRLLDTSSAISATEEAAHTLFDEFTRLPRRNLPDLHS